MCLRHLIQYNSLRIRFRCTFEKIKPSRPMQQVRSFHLSTWPMVTMHTWPSSNFTSNLQNTSTPHFPRMIVLTFDVLPCLDVKYTLLHANLHDSHMHRINPLKIIFTPNDQFPCPHTFNLPSSWIHRQCVHDVQ